MARVLGLVLVAIVSFASPALAEYPDKTIRIVVPYPPGGFNDTLGRIVAQKLTDDWGVPAVVENRPGGGTLIGTTRSRRRRPMATRSWWWRFHSP